MANERIFTIKIDGLSTSYTEAVKLRDVLNQIKDVHAKVTVETDKVNKANEQSSRTTREKTKALTEEEKAAKKLAETQDKASRVITQMERDQVAANLQLRERTRSLQLQVQSENAATNSIEAMRVELSKLKDEWKRLDVDSVEFEELSKTIDELNKKIKEHEQATGDFRRNVGNYESATKGLEETLEGLGEGINQTAENTKGMLNMFQAGVGALALFGDESESTNKMLSDLGKILAIVSALQAANNILLTKGAISSKLASVMEGIHAIQIRARALSISLANKNTVTAIALQKVLNLVQKASPLMWLLGAFVAVVGGITAYNIATGDATNTTKQYKSSLDGVSFATEEARDAHDQHLRKVRDLQIEYRVLIGDMTKYQAKLLQIANSADDRIVEINKKYNEQIKEIQEQYKTPFWQTNPFTGEGTGVQYEAQMKERNAKIKALESDRYNEIQKIREEKEHEGLIAQEIQNKERIELQDRLTSDLKTGLDKELFDLQNQRNKSLDEAKEKGIETNKVYEIYAKKENEIRDKYRKENADKAKDNADKQKAIVDSIDKYQADTAKLENQNSLTQIEVNRTKAKSIEDINQTYKDQAEIIKKENDSVLKSAIKEFDELLEKAKESTQKTADLTALKNERIKALEVQLANDLLALEREKAEKVNEINEKTIKNRQDLLNLELSQLDTFFNSIESNLDNLESRDSKGIINVEATRKNIDEANRSLQEYLEHIKKTKSEVEKYYNDMLALYPVDSIEYKQLLLEKQNTLIDFQKKEADVNREITENTKSETELQKQYWNELYEKLSEYTDKVMTSVNAVFDATNSLLQSQLDEANEKYDAISQKYDEVVNKREESNSRLQELEDEAKTARGGRFIILQQQISKEMEVNRQLADQEKNLAKEKEKQEKEIAKKEKQQKRLELGQNIAQGIANTALGVVKAYAASPLTFGLPWSAFIAASGALQVGVMAAQLAKLEDGGLLNGKRHSQGGMRVEGTNIEVEGGEYVVNRESTSKNLGLIRYINNQRRELTPTDINTFFSKTSQGFEPPFKKMFETGGQLPTISNSTTVDSQIIANAIKNIKIEPRVAVTDINRVQNELVRVDNWTDL